MKKGSILRVIGVALMVIACIYGVSSVFVQKRIREEMAGIPGISGEAQLRAAMEQPAQVYLLTDMVLGGKGVPDPLRILKNPDDYLYLYYRQERYERQDGDSSDRRWEYRSNGSETRYSASLTLFRDIPLAIDGQYRFEGRSYDVAEKELTSGARDKLKGRYYYPKGISQKIGTIRYRIELVRQGEKVSMKAEVGNGKVRPLIMNSGKSPTIVIGGDMASLTKAYTSQARGIVYMAIVIMGFGAALLVFAKIRAEKANSIQKEIGNG